MLNPLDHPICLRAPLRLAPTAWAEHVPFAFYLIDVVRPKTLVELGTFAGTSYCAFCQAVAELKVDCKCYAVDSWEGDAQSGYFDKSVLEDLKQHHDPLYGKFSTLIESTFDDARESFTDGSVDLLHIDGYHAYESVKHDFETWLPKMSSRGIVLFHDTRERTDDFGVWKLWDELKALYPNFEFDYGHGLGVIAVGDSIPAELRELFEAPVDQAEIIREMFKRLGERLSLKIEHAHEVESLEWKIRDSQQVNSALTTQVDAHALRGDDLTRQNAAKDQIIAERDAAISWLKQEVSELQEQHSQDQATISRLNALQDEIAELTHRLETANDKTAELDAKLSKLSENSDEMIRTREQGIAWLRTELTTSQRENTVLAARLSAKTEELDQVLNSAGWRWLQRYGVIKYRYLLPVYRLLGKGKQDQYRSTSASTAGNGDEYVVSTPEAPQTTASALLEFETNRARDMSDNDPEGFFNFLTLLPQPREEELTAIVAKKSPSKPLHKHDVICFSIIDWDFRFQRPQQIMAQFAAHGHRVFYISTTRTLADDSVPRVTARLVRENVYEVQLAARWLPDVYGEAIEGRNKTALLESIEHLRRLFHINEAIAYTMISSWTSLALETRERWGWRVVYDCMDEWESFPGIKKPLLDAEQRLVDEADLVVVTAQRLLEKWQGRNEHIVLARNAVDYDFYVDRYAPNSVLTGIEHPIVGYYGAIADWFDTRLLAFVARSRPQYSFVLLGGVFDVDISELKSLPNVHFLGQQPYETMPQYLYHFDACIIPFKINKITEATDPVKVYEYLSAGKPVVTVALPELDPCKELIYIAGDKHEFAEQLDRALTENDEQAVADRIGFASRQTWPIRYAAIEAGLSAATPRASIIIVTYNNLPLNKLCLESIIRNTDYPNYEVVVVDNNSLDGTPAYLRYMSTQHQHINVLLNKNNAGFASANNQGISHSSGDYIVLLNNDTIVPAGWLSRLLQPLRNPTVGMVGPVTNFTGNEAKIEPGYQTIGEMEAFAEEHVWRHDHLVADIHMLAMFCVAFKRETYEAIGPLDEQFGLGMFEDDDYSLRMKQARLRVICAADVFVHHFGQAAFKKLIERGEYNELFEKNRHRYETKWSVKWIPHVNAPLDFAPLTESQFEAAGNS
jgi:GT2 family glycosyltransferase/glycosyltransferase involved in cell wall biosynthesis